MSDNSTLPAFGEIIATDDIGGVKYQRMKIVHGDNGVNDGDVSISNPLTVFLKNAVLDVNFGNTSIAVTASSDLPVTFSNTSIEVTAATPLLVKKSAPASSSISHVAVSTASDVLILASNANRKGAVIENNSTGMLYLLLGTGTAGSSNRSLSIDAGDTLVLENGDYTGVIRGIWDVGSSGNANITEFS